ncbi:kinase-like domain-containing protein [Kalaharituber pfeilii]|nr:kinase-like domain-containing protein [Kalaharituber pfeilii]
MAQSAAAKGKRTSQPTPAPQKNGYLSPQPARVNVGLPPVESLTFKKLPPSAYSSQANSSASSEIDENEAANTPATSLSPQAGTTPTKKSLLGTLLEKQNAELGDIITVTNEYGQVESYEVALEHDFISRDVRSRPVTRSGQTPQPAQAKRKMCAEDFEVLKCLGKGAYGTVLLVRHIKTGKLYAQKQLKKASLITTKKLVEQTMTERQILEAIRHPFIVKLYYAFQDHQKLYLILEYAQGGELFMHLAAEHMLSEDTAAFYMASLILALAHLHENAGVVYRDLKPENCLLDHEGYLLLTDFGLSKVALPGEGSEGGSTSRCNSWVGTVEYMAPEIVMGKEYDERVDWWSLGALGVDLLTGSPPFTGNNRAKIQEKIAKGKLMLPYYLSMDAKDLLGKLLQKNPAKRWGVKDVPKMKKHRFFRKVDWEALERREVKGGPPIRPVVTDPMLAENFSKEFTMLACSPPVRVGGMNGMVGLSGLEKGVDEEKELFGGFSYVGSWGERLEGWMGERVRREEEEEGEYGAQWCGDGY